MSKSIFISCVHEDSAHLAAIKQWEQRGLLGNIVPTYETEDKRQEGRTAIRNYLQKKIEGSSGVIVLIGNNTHNHDWITVEVELANSYHKKIVCMRIPNTTGAPPPILANYKTVVFDPTVLLKEF